MTETQNLAPGPLDEASMEEKIREIVSGIINSSKKGPEALFEDAAGYVGDDGNNDSVNASSQILYYSTQALKIDPSLFSFAPNVVEMTPTKIKILGHEVKFPWASTPGPSDALPEGTPSPDLASEIPDTGARDATTENRETHNLRVESERNLERIREIRRSAGTSAREMQDLQRIATDADRNLRVLRTGISDIQRILGGM
ncbi:hypothetical protein [Streptomyces sp. NPDC006270]|uniref:hypothetical protein n=1 Tax=Streptomyces sp. NPDC006270 TaxID=3364741 RepID=UPI0036C0EA1D